MDFLERGTLAKKTTEEKKIDARNFGISVTSKIIETSPTITSKDRDICVMPLEQSEKGKTNDSVFIHNKLTNDFAKNRLTKPVYDKNNNFQQLNFNSTDSILSYELQDENSLSFSRYTSAFTKLCGQMFIPFYDIKVMYQYFREDRATNRESNIENQVLSEDSLYLQEIIESLNKQSCKDEVENKIKILKEFNNSIKTLIECNKNKVSTKNEIIDTIDGLNSLIAGIQVYKPLSYLTNPSATDSNSIQIIPPPNEYLETKLDGPLSLLTHTLPILMDALQYVSFQEVSKASKIPDDVKYAIDKMLIKKLCNEASGLILYGALNALKCNVAFLSPLVYLSIFSALSIALKLRNTKTANNLCFSGSLGKEIHKQMRNNGQMNNFYRYIDKDYENLAKSAVFYKNKPQTRTIMYSISNINLMSKFLDQSIDYLTKNNIELKKEIESSSNKLSSNESFNSFAQKIVIFQESMIKNYTAQKNEIQREYIKIGKLRESMLRHDNMSTSEYNKTQAEGFVCVSEFMEKKGLQIYILKNMPQNVVKRFPDVDYQVISTSVLTSKTDENSLTKKQNAKSFIKEYYKSADKIIDNDLIPHIKNLKREILEIIIIRNQQYKLIF